MNEKIVPIAKAAAPAPEVYEAPRVEVVLDADSLQREVHYAGEVSGPVG